MVCDTPGFLDFADSSDLSGLDYGFIMDNVTELLSMKKADGTNFIPFRYIQNPTVFAFDDVVQYTNGMKLEIMVTYDTSTLTRLCVSCFVPDYFLVSMLDKILYITAVRNALNHLFICIL